MAETAQRQSCTLQAPLRRVGWPQLPVELQLWGCCPLMPGNEAASAGRPPSQKPAPGALGNMVTLVSSVVKGTECQKIASARSVKVTACELTWKTISLWSLPWSKGRNVK